MSLRPGCQLRHRRSGSACYRSGSRDSVYTKNNARRLFSPGGLEWDPFGKERQRRADLGLLHTDRHLAFCSTPSPYKARLHIQALCLVTPIAKRLPPGLAGTVFRALQGRAARLEAAAKTPPSRSGILHRQEFAPNGSSRGYVGPLDITDCKRRSEHCSRQHLFLCGGCTSGAGAARVLCLNTRNIFGRADSAESLFSAGFFWLTEGNSSYNARRWK